LQIPSRTLRSTVETTETNYWAIVVVVYLAILGRMSTRLN